MQSGLPPGIDSVASERAVFRWCRIFLDRWVSTYCTGIHSFDPSQLTTSTTLSDNSIKENAASSVSDEVFAQRAEKYPIDTPDTKEAYYIRDIFQSLFPSEAAAKTAVRFVEMAVTTYLFFCLPIADGEGTLYHHLDGSLEVIGAARLILVEGVLAFMTPHTSDQSTFRSHCRSSILKLGREYGRGVIYSL